MIYKVFRVLNLYASRLVNTTSKNDWVTRSLLVYMIRDFFLLGLSRGHDFRPDYEKLELYPLFFFQLRLLLESTIRLWAIWRIPHLSLLTLTELTFFLSIHTKAPMCKARECRWIWRTIITHCRRAYCANVCYYYDHYLLIKTCGVGTCTWLQAVLSYGLPKFLKTDSLPVSFSPDK